MNILVSQKEFDQFKKDHELLKQKLKIAIGALEYIENSYNSEYSFNIAQAVHEASFALNRIKNIGIND